MNAAGRLDDMARGIECLLAPDRDAALPIAQELDRLNRERRGIEAQMRDDALALVAESDDVGVVLHEPDWHEGFYGNGTLPFVGWRIGVA